MLSRVLKKLNFSQIRHISKCSVANQLTSPGPATPIEPLTIPLSEAIEKVYPPKLEKIAADITSLNLLEVSELSQLLKKRLNLPDQPMMPAGFAMSAMAAPQVEEEEIKTPEKVKTEFTVKLTGFDEKQKIAVIKELKNVMEGYNLVQAKKLLEALPAVLKADTTKEESDRLKDALVKVGAIIEIE